MKASAKPTGSGPSGIFQNPYPTLARTSANVNESATRPAPRAPGLLCGRNDEILIEYLLILR